MSIKNIIDKIGMKRISHWTLLACISLFLVGLFQLVLFWSLKTYVKSTYFWQTQTQIFNAFSPYSFMGFLVWFIQVYSVLFIPLMVYIGFKYKNSINNKKIRIFSISFLIGLFIFLVSIFKLLPLPVDLEVAINNV